MAVKELSARERNLVIGLAIDADLDKYHSFLDGNKFDFKGDSGEKNIGAAILTIATYLQDDGGYADDYKEQYEDDNTAPHMKWRWGRSVLFYDGFNNTYKLETYVNKDRARREFR